MVLTSIGIEQAHRAGMIMRQRGLDFDRCYTDPESQADTMTRVLPFW